MSWLFVLLLCVTIALHLVWDEGEDIGPSDDEVE